MILTVPSGFGKKKKREERKKKKDGDVQFHKNTDQTTAAKPLTASLAH